VAHADRKAQAGKLTNTEVSVDRAHPEWVENSRLSTASNAGSLLGRETPGQYFRLISEHLTNVIDHAPLERWISVPALDQKRSPTRRPRPFFVAGARWRRIQKIGVWTI
jgi:hypothetical protein